VKITYRRPAQPENDPYRSDPLPVDRPAAIYYRQSTDAQIGNINTTLQTVDMFEHLVRQGWSRDSIFMIDMDAGVSGSTRLKDRPGMSHLLDLIETGQIGLVASQDVDRFFRDVTQIQTNIFIDVCKRHQVRIMTPRMIYDFNHPTMGAYHMKIFRDEAQHAADFLEYHIRGRLHKSKAHISEQGLWAGRTVVIGYMCDMREKLPDGSRNPNHRRYVELTPCADIIRTYFKLFRENKRNLRQTYLHIEEHGPFYPEPEALAEMTPDGFRTDMRVEYRSAHTGRLMPSESALKNIFTNVIYIGHWVHQGAIAQFHNHEAIVDERDFMYAFNAISSTDFYGDPNPNYQPYRAYTRHDKEGRPEPPPIYAGLIFTDDHNGERYERMNTHWNSYNHIYHYSCRRRRRDRKCMVFSVKATRMDKVINDLLLERLKATTIDEESWQKALAATQQTGHHDLQRIRGDIRAAERAQAAILENLKMLQHPDMVRNLEASYSAKAREIERLRSELAELESGRRETHTLLESRPVLDMIIARWQDVPRDKQRELFEALATHATCNQVDDVQREVVVHWRDDTTTSHIFRWGDGKRFHWSKAELERMREMVEAGRPQWEILKAFPHWRWEGIASRYAQHFAPGRKFVPCYKGEKKYPYSATWYDTEEYKQEQAALHFVTSSTSLHKRFAN
jgi:DNA invertase Pin-like site-specific DNA recombinase